MATYQELCRVQDGKVTLASKHRIDSNLNFTCLTWRTKRETSNTNRYLYLEQGKFWTTQLTTVRGLLIRARDCGMFESAAHRWPKESLNAIDTFKCDQLKVSVLMKEILTDELIDSIWWNAPDTRLLIGVEPDGLWRKVLILSESRNLATLRSLTLRNDYKHKYNYPLRNGWQIDRSMLDADASIHEFYLTSLSNTELSL